ncbi:MAG: MFS transporter, partial [Nocardioides sp.]|uniref:MFS transporter n=1 Tax=Nocardioides sp. TaxID=35761 RepID=UPI0039E47F6B
GARRRGPRRRCRLGERTTGGRAMTAIQTRPVEVGRRGEVLILATCILANFMAYGTYAAFTVAVPAMSRDLDGGVTTATWMVLAFTLAMASTTLIFARLSDELGRRWLYVGGIVVFAVTAVVCTVDTGDAMLIAMRAVQGMAAAASMATSTAVITDVFPLSRLPIAMGIFMSVAGASAVFGPMLGGVLIDHVGWRSIFWASVLFGGLAVLTGWDGLKHVHAPPVRPFPFDVPGAVSSIVAIAALVYGIQGLGRSGAGATVAAALLASVLALAGFVAVERRSAHPLVDLAVVSGQRSGLYVSALGTALGGGGLVVMVTLYLEIVEGFSAAAAGAFLLPMGVMLLIGAPMAGVLQRWASQRTLTAWGGVGIGISTVLAAVVVAVDGSTRLLWPLLVVSGTAQGLYQAALSGRLMAGMAPNRRGIANGVRSTLINGGNALSTALVIAIVTMTAGASSIRETDAAGARPAFVTAGLLLGALALLGAYAAWLARPAAEELR